MNTETYAHPLDTVIPGWYSKDVWKSNLSGDRVLALNYVKTYLEVLRHVDSLSHLVCFDTVSEHVILFKHSISTLKGFADFFGGRIISGHCDDAIDAIENFDTVELISALARLMEACHHDIDVFGEELS